MCQLYFNKKKISTHKPLKISGNQKFQETKEGCNLNKQTNRINPKYLLKRVKKKQATYGDLPAKNKTTGTVKPLMLNATPPIQDST